VDDGDRQDRSGAEWLQIGHSASVKELPAHPYFLVVYDYGTGGVWVRLRAESIDAVREKYPELVVIDSRPPSMSPDVFEEIQSTARIVDVDSPDDPFLDALRRSRE
jgi:hypothetical protein